MPTYDYECKGCGHVFEYFQAMSEEPLSECPKCKGEVKRLIGGGMGIIFKGSGFYVTDNKKNSSSSTSVGSTSPAASTGGKQTSGDSSSKK